MRPFIRRRKEVFRCSVCGRSGDIIVQSPYTFKHKKVCTMCANTMRFNALGNYAVNGYEIRKASSREKILHRFLEHSKELSW